MRTGNTLGEKRMKHGLSLQEEAQGAPLWSVKEFGLLASGLLLLSIALYWRTLSANFVADDWLVLDDLSRLGPWQAFLERANPVGSLVYRPLAWLYFAMMYGAFGLNPVPFHVVLLLLHVVNGTLVAWIGTRLAGDRAAGILAGCLFVALISLHLDCFLWFVGVFDIGAMTCALLSAFFLIRSRMKTSAVLMACAFLFKEAAAFLPILFIAWILLERGRLRSLFFHGIVTVAYIVAKFLGASPFLVNRGNGHAMDPSWSVLAERTWEYISWVTISFLPFLESRVTTGVLVLLLLLAWSVSRYRAPRKVPFAHIVLLVIWVFIALAPVLLLKNQSAKYYAFHAAVPAAVLASIVIREITTRAFPKRGTIVAAVLVAGVAAANAWYTESMFSLGMKQRVIHDGYFHLIGREAIVDALEDSLRAFPQPLPHGTRIFVRGASLDATGQSAAVRLWFRDSTLRLSAGGPRQPGDSANAGGEDGARVITIDLSEAAAPKPE
ncbi:MAG: Tetratricopeptide 1 repeat-containing protein [Bacteroidetes bacterium]|nr:Tetratricopeptide 1 repeat-containing protein [Bacteroidota bacterium]